MKPKARQVLIFDLDETLYSSPRLARAYADLAADLVARRWKETREEGRGRLLEERARLSRALGDGSTATVSLTLESLGVGLSEWIGARDAEIDPTPLVKRDEALRRRLRILSAGFRLAILTNNSRRHTEAITKALGVRDLFGQRIFTVDQTLKLKPDSEVLARVLRKLRVSPRQCVSLGDRYHVDVAPAVRLGMRGVCVDSAASIYGVLDRLIAEMKERRERGT